MTQLPDSLFRAYDIRGIFDDTLTLEAARLIGRAIGSEVRRQGGDTLALARDGTDEQRALAAAALDAYEGRLLNKDGTPAWPLQEEEGASASKEDL